MVGGFQMMQTLSFILAMYFAISYLLCLLSTSLQFLPAALPQKHFDRDTHPHAL